MGKVTCSGEKWRAWRSVSLAPLHLTFSPFTGSLRSPFTSFREEEVRRERTTVASE